MTYPIHALIDLAFTLLGWRVGKFCNHNWHRVVLAITIALIGSAIQVTLVG